MEIIRRPGARNGLYWVLLWTLKSAPRSLCTTSWQPFCRILDRFCALDIIKEAHAELRPIFTTTQCWCWHVGAQHWSKKTALVAILLEMPENITSTGAKKREISDFQCCTGNIQVPKYIHFANSTILGFFLCKLCFAVGGHTETSKCKAELSSRTYLQAQDRTIMRAPL